MKFGKSIIAMSAATAALLVLTACNGSDGTDGIDGTNGTNGTNGTDGLDAGTSKWSFVELSVPVTDEEKSTNRAASGVTNNQDGITDALNFTLLMSAGDSNNGEVFGASKDYQDNLITNEDGSPFLCDGGNGDARGSGLDHTSILVKNDRLFAVAQFECGVGSMYGFELEQAANGTLSVKADSMQFISQKEGFGGWVHCAGMTTPWQSHLGSEEYEPDARRAMETDPVTKLDTGDSYLDEVTQLYWHDENNANAEYDANPYFYGWIPEVTVDGSTATPTYSYTKHFSMGRAAWEMAYVMPDEKTAYLSDDGTNVGFYMYVADAAQDLSAGTLYAAKWIQTSGVGAGAADLLWIKLGHATDAEIKTIVAAEPQFSDIFETEDVNESFECPTEGFTYIYAAEGPECLKLKAGQEKTAAFLETRRYAAMLGATVEYRKEEGVTFDPDHGRLFVAMSQVRYGMLDGNSRDDGGNNDIRVEENKCGAVYALDVLGAAETAYDMNKEVINSEYVVKNQYAVVEGMPASYPAGSQFEAYDCSPNGISEPDNVSYVAGENILIIGEDTGYHPNDFMWAYDVVTGELKRVFSTPYGSETTSPFWYKDINGWSYLSAVTQHPFGEVSSSHPDYYLVDTNARSTFGVVGPFDFTVGDGIGSR